MTSEDERELAALRAELEALKAETATLRKENEALEVTLDLLWSALTLRAEGLSEA